MRVFFFKGVQLWEIGEEWHGSPVRSTDGFLIGVKQTYGTINPESPGWRREVVVRTFIEPPEPLAGLNVAETLDLLLLQIDAALTAASTSLGDLSRCWDTLRRATVSGGPYSGASQVVSIGTPGGDWTPTANAYVLVRDPTTEAGFVAQIEATGVGTVTLTLESAITAGWEIVDVVSYYPDTRYDTLNPGAASVEDVSDQYRGGVEYRFLSASDPVNASAHDVPRGNS